jgi:hypothetical protein
MSENTPQHAAAPEWFSPRVRAWLYGIVAAVVPLLIVLGTLSDDIGQAVLNIAAALLAIGSSTMARAHVDR